MGHSAFIHPCLNTIIFTVVPILPSDMCVGVGACMHACVHVCVLCITVKHPVLSTCAVEWYSRNPLY